MQFSSHCMKTRLKSFEFKPLDMDYKPISYSLPPLIIVEIFGRKLEFFMVSYRENGFPFFSVNIQIK